MIAVVLATAAGLLWFGANRVAAPTRSRSTGPDPRAVLVDLVDGLVAALGAGAAPAGAVEVTCRLAAGRLSQERTSRCLSRIAAEAAAGADLVEVWERAAADLRGSPAGQVIASVARGWTLSARLGCPIAPSLAVSAGMLRAEIERDRRITAAAAGPRATVQLLTVLPVLGLVLASVAGLSPWPVLLSPAALVTLVPGIALVALGRVLTGRLIARAARSAPVPA